MSSESAVEPRVRSLRALCTLLTDRHTTPRGERYPLEGAGTLIVPHQMWEDATDDDRVIATNLANIYRISLKCGFVPTVMKVRQAADD